MDDERVQETLHRLIGGRTDIATSEFGSALLRFQAACESEDLHIDSIVFSQPFRTREDDYAKFFGIRMRVKEVY